MAYNELLADRVRELLVHVPNVIEKRMMGGLTFMVNDKMCVGILKDELMCRVDKTVHAKLVERHGCRTMDFTNKPMIGYILIEESVLQKTSDLKEWISLSLEFNPHAKAAKKKKT